jgi:CheY-like chemotaxis protein
MMHSQCNAKELTVKTSLDASLKTIIADERKLKQIFLNLLSNAIKYSPVKGLIEIGSSRENEFIKFFVSDNGVGIADDHKDKIFSEFYQINRERDEGLGGTGIGLALTRRLVKLHGGEIGVQNNAEKGSRFWFTLPLKGLSSRQDAITSDESNSLPMASHRILVVEDNEVNLALILDMLSIHDHKVIVARNGKEAIDLARRHKPELILMDILMPVMNGFEAVRALRALPETSQIPIIAVTASVAGNDREKCLFEGFSEYLAKPINSASLTTMMKRFLK